ncbi:M56 family metallopeptidase [Micromonospora sp. NPDC005806]|uniref:M56 family metallopeptidase n=1 Tax=Micromonospora sp. NPDC005806 TaxID=3364234 RepID=UPI00369E5EC7
MDAAVIATLLACVALAVAGPPLADRLPPATAVRLLVPGAVLGAVATVFVLATVTFTWLGQLGEVAEVGAWSPQVLRLLDPIPVPAAITAGALLVLATLWAAISGVRIARALVAVRRADRDLTPRASHDVTQTYGGSPVVVVDSETIEAFTTPGPRARIVVTTGILKALDAEGRQVLLAHEWSHHRHHHPWWILTADLAAGLNPLLRPTAVAVRQATERWADEDAALRCERRYVAATIARVALLSMESRRPAAAAAAGGLVPARVQALLRPPPRLRVRHLATALTLVLAVVVGSLTVWHDGECLFEQAAQASDAVQVASPAAR